MMVHTLRRTTRQTWNAWQEVLRENCKNCICAHCRESRLLSIILILPDYMTKRSHAIL